MSPASMSNYRTSCWTTAADDGWGPSESQQLFRPALHSSASPSQPGNFCPAGRTERRRKAALARPPGLILSSGNTYQTDGAAGSSPLSAGQRITERQTMEDEGSRAAGLSLICQTSTSKPGTTPRFQIRLNQTSFAQDFSYNAVAQGQNSDLYYPTKMKTY